MSSFRESGKAISLEREYPMHTRDLLREGSPEEAVQHSPAEGAMESASQAAQDLRDTVSRLIIRLEPILAPSENMPMKEGGMQEAVDARRHSAVVTGFEDLESTIVFVTQRISNAIGNLEI